MKDGEAHGVGEWIARNKYGAACSYTGTWVDGKMHGYGVFKRVGVFVQDGNWH